MNHLEANNKVTLESLVTNRTPEVLPHVIKRLEEVYEMCGDCINVEMTVLDIGTKDGFFFDILMEKGFDVSNLIGVDCCKEVVDICVENGYFVYEGDVQNMVNSDIKFDFIFIIHTLEHIPNPQIAIDKCFQMLNPDGYIFIEVPIQSQIHDPELWGHYHPFTSQEQVKNLFQNDYNVVKEDWQKTKSKSPWYRVLFQRV